MLNDPLFIIAAIACLVVLVILMLGIGTFGKGGEGSAKRSNKLMRYRIYAQGLAVALIVLFVWLRKSGVQ
ncbi:twin transmembrane helix small protein [Pseudorhodobacter wandonensis]|uniref:twin transmembrane helix small protein n=1 Tax=Pseudorhodobacter wandonensis TaxID=1120568 RepID=UPI00067B4DB8|nr:twin transmembrane helix small protein [Pseudorhodobacter wandonensis]